MLCKQVRSLCLVNLFFPQLRIKTCSLRMLESLTPSFFSSPPSLFIFNSLSWLPLWVSHLFIQCLLLLLGNWQRSTSWRAVSQPTILPFSQPQQRSWGPLIPALFSLALPRAGATQSFLAECFLINTKQLTVQAASLCKQLLINAGGLWWRRVCNKPLRWEWTGGCMNWVLAEGICVYVRYMLMRSREQRGERCPVLVPRTWCHLCQCWMGKIPSVLLVVFFFSFSNIWQFTSSLELILSSGVAQVVYWHFL